MTVLRALAGPLLILALVAAVASVPAGTGTWVYDDYGMLDSPMMDGPEDIPAALWRTSAHYIAKSDTPPDDGYLTTTWRPTTMVTLTASHVLGGERPGPHHVVSWLLLVTLGGLLLVTVGDGRKPSVGWALGAGIVALHPALGEAWLWINGRSDLVAGVALAGLGAVVWRTRERAPGTAELALAALITLAGAGGKETFVPAAVMVGLCALGRPGGRLLVGAIGTGVATFVGLRTVVLGSLESGERVASQLLTADTLERVPLVWAAGLQTLALPAPRPMRMLAWELRDGWSAGAALTLGALLVVVVALLARKQWRPVLLLGGAAGCLAPTAYVGAAYWAGLDRYLVLPAILCFFAAWELGRGWTPGSKARRPLLAVLGASALVVVASLAFTATFYASSEEFCTTMVAQRPEDPTGYLFYASEMVSERAPKTASAILNEMPDVTLPPPIAREKIRLLLDLGRLEEAADLAESAHAQHPDARWLGLTTVVVRLARRDEPGARQILDRYTTDAAWCPIAKQWVGGFVASGPQMGPEVRASAVRLFEGAVCGEIELPAVEEDVAAP
ncbi:MAG: hypothetical protein KDA24_13575 [Deltaproteobacteria bacterium]|nr:hypothetical protein [Deltaproteobacteria bacterium]